MRKKKKIKRILKSVEKFLSGKPKEWKDGLLLCYNCNRKMKITGHTLNKDCIIYKCEKCGMKDYQPEKSQEIEV